MNTKAKSSTGEFPITENKLAQLDEFTTEEITAPKKYYDQGWNAYIDGTQYTYNATRDWRDGWKDCKMAREDNDPASYTKI
jgi:hypothetical protein